MCNLAEEPIAPSPSIWPIRNPPPYLTSWEAPTEPRLNRQGEASFELAAQVGFRDFGGCGKSMIWQASGTSRLSYGVDPFGSMKHRRPPVLLNFAARAPGVDRTRLCLKTRQDADNPCRKRGNGAWHIDAKSVTNNGNS